MAIKTLLTDSQKIHQKPKMPWIKMNEYVLLASITDDNKTGPVFEHISL
jgi:hypothetical protein